MAWFWNPSPNCKTQAKLAPPKCVNCDYYGVAVDGDPRKAHCRNPNRVSNFAFACRKILVDETYNKQESIAQDLVHQRCGPEGILFKPKKATPQDENPFTEEECIAGRPERWDPNHPGFQAAREAKLAELAEQRLARPAPDLTPREEVPTPPGVGTSQIVITLENPIHTQAFVCALEIMQTRLKAQSTMATSVTLGVMIHDQSKPPALWNAFSIGYNVHIKEVRTEPDNLPRWPLHSRAMSS